MTTAISPLYGTHYHTEKILRNTPSWWDKTPRSGSQAGSTFYALLSSMGESDWSVGGHEDFLYLYEGTGTLSGFTFTDSSASWEVNAFRGCYFEDQNVLRRKYKARYIIASNTATDLVLQSTTTESPDGTVRGPPADGAYRIIRPSSALAEVRHDIQIRTAEYADLDVKGRNVGVYRPLVGMSDSLYRKLIPLLSWGPKLTRPSIEEVLRVLVGTAQGVSWDTFETGPREFVVELYASSPLPAGSGSYLIPDGSTVDVVDPLSSFITPDSSADYPSPQHAVYLSGVFVLNDGTPVDEELIKRILRLYCRAVGITVTVDIFGV